MDFPTPEEAGSINVTTLTYHTVDHAVEHLEGEQYDVTDYELAMTLVGCGFVMLTEGQPKQS